MDTASVFIQARNSKEKPTQKVRLNPIFDPFPLTSVNYMPPAKMFEYRLA